ncbi:type VII secretion-associated serine protease mycosin [Mycobacterium simiae]|uniref:Type VII secretion-associated serine protease mycosin n=1 Tax=Mycobacterium simiae TaxID=1784 RepID=A0A5B1BK66_MYCSI|nr:type VII secretion-associated serine protease mycosin [Mycobacterium simiae]KAA1248361.1 type VII secretion-associated serine protease mycosin [Mycobacterium simiae]
MSSTTSRVVRLLAVAALSPLSVGAIPSAHAVSPPPIDQKWLPTPALPAPPQPTVQREVCATATAASGRSDPPAQLAALDLPQVWQLTRGAGQRVAVLDTGVTRHRRLPQLVAGGDYVSTGDGTQDCDAHGTIVAGIIAAAADSKEDGFSGVAPDATVISVRQSSAKFAPVADGFGSGVGDVNTLAQAVRTAADLGASVINISSVACVPAATTLDDRALGAALAYAVDVKNAVIVAAAGNTAGPAPCPAQRPDVSRDTATVAVSPAWYDDYVLTVASVSTAGVSSSFSLAGPWVDVAATGEDVTSLSPTGDGIVNGVVGQEGSGTLSGTSYAAPVVSGLAALIRARFPALTARQVMQRIESTAHHPPAGWDPVVGHGIVDALAAVSTDSPAPTTTSQTGAVATVAPAAPAPPNHRARDTALGGTVVCVVILVATLSSFAPRLRRSGQDTVMGG